jgi:Gpi18-like mannosyltransferase
MAEPLGPAQVVGASVPAAGHARPQVAVVGRRHETALLLVGLLVAIAVRAILIPTNGGWTDIDDYAGWVHRLATDMPFGAAYQLHISYLPVLVAVFGALAHVVPGFATATDASDLFIRVALKLPPLIADGASAAGVYLLAGGRRPGRVAASLAILVIPSTWYLSSWWGQYDAIYVAAAIWVVVLAVRDRRVAAGVLLGLALMTKPQALPLAVPFAVWMLARWRIRRGVGVVAISCFVAAGTWMPFVPWGGISDYLQGVGSMQSNQFAVLSFSAWNPWWLIQGGVEGVGLSDSTAILGPLTPRVIGLILTLFAVAVVALAMIRRPTKYRLLLGLTGATLVSFCLMTTMHERYAYASLVFLAPLLARPAVRVVWAILAATITINIVAAMPPNQRSGSVIPLYGGVGVAGSAAMIVATIMVLALLVREDPEDKDLALPTTDPGRTPDRARLRSWRRASTQPASDLARPSGGELDPLS